MRTKPLLMIGLLSVLSMGAYAAGSPVHENFTDLIALSNTAVELGQQGDAPGFIAKTNETLEVLNAQEERGSSVRLQRADEELRAALKAAKAGNLPAGVAAVEKGIAVMKAEK